MRNVLVETSLERESMDHDLWVTRFEKNFRLRVQFRLNEGIELELILLGN